MKLSTWLLCNLSHSNRRYRNLDRQREAARIRGERKGKLYPRHVNAWYVYLMAMSASPNTINRLLARLQSEGLARD